MSSLFSLLPAWIFYVILFGGILGTLAVIMFEVFIPLQYRLGIQVGSAVALALGPFFIGAISTEERWQLEVVKQKAEIVRLEALSHQITEKIVVQYVDRKIYIKEKGNEIIKQIPMYITKKADDNCTITNGVIRLLNSAAENEVPDATRSFDGRSTKNGIDTKQN